MPLAKASRNFSQLQCEKKLATAVYIKLCICVCSREATKCYCGASNCRGVIGSGKQSPLKSTRRKSSRAKDRKKADMFSDLFVS